MSKITVEGRVPDESPELQQLLRDMARLLNVLAGRVFVGSGTPEGVIRADIGSIYLRTDGSTSTTLYVKTGDAGGNTTWTAK